MLRIPFEEIREELYRILLTRKCPEEKAKEVAHEMARNSLEGVYSHGINRFPRLMRNIDAGIVHPDADPVIVNRFGALMSMDGNLGLGVVNASIAMEHAIELAKEHGIGLIALRNTNHWMRAATYGYQACDAGMAAICFSNTIPNMPTWGAVDARLGNNPMVLAIPREGGHVLLDMAASQFSYGALELAQLQGRKMEIDAGFDEQGSLTRDPATVIRTRRILPTGYWKGAGLSFLLDLFAGCMSLGNTTMGVGKLSGDEHGQSQMFIAINYRAIAPKEISDRIAQEAVENLLASKKDEKAQRIVYPGQRMQETKEQNLKQGIPVDERIWAEIKSFG
jgi:3-dehydro-L-gulonate 2-dehydrogenase